jgi:hypothetical protein
MSADVKVYQTMVAVDELAQGLKPGMSAEVTVLIDDILNHVLTIPVQAIIGTPAMGRQRKCFVMTPEGPREREIVVGLSNDKMAEIRSGLQEGEEVALNPRVLLSDAERVRMLGSERGDFGKGAGKNQPPSGPGAGTEGGVNGKSGGWQGGGQQGKGSPPGGRPGR